TSSLQTIKLILLPKKQERFDFKSFVNPETVGFIPLSPAVLQPPHVLRAFFYTNRRKGVKMIFK
ncbi:TPA: hypothetical protein ACGNJ4_002330, partial [Streptococcus agalactiae]